VFADTGTCIAAFLDGGLDCARASGWSDELDACIAALQTLACDAADPPSCAAPIIAAAD